MTNQNEKPKLDKIWEKGKPIKGESPNVWRKDSCGNKIKRDKYGEEGLYAWEIDHIKPKAKGGGNELSNLQPLQPKANRKKADKK